MLFSANAIIEITLPLILNKQEIVWRHVCQRQKDKKSVGGSMKQVDGDQKRERQERERERKLKKWYCKSKMVLQKHKAWNCLEIWSSSKTHINRQFQLAMARSDTQAPCWSSIGQNLEEPAWSDTRLYPTDTQGAVT